MSELEKRTVAPCCGASCAAIHWNPHNGVVQCHRCGVVYEPKGITTKDILITETKAFSFERAVESLINEYSRENASDTPDFILAKFVTSCLEAFENAVKARGEWYGNMVPEGDRE